MDTKFVTSILGKYVKSPIYRLYESRLAKESENWTKPEHVGIILDGNRRYAKSLGLSNIIVGHELGADKLFEVMGWCTEFNIKVISIWIFSLDNFSRGKDEVDAILALIERKTKEYTADNDDVHKKQVQVHYIGKLELLPQSLRDAISEMESATKNYNSQFLNVAVAYGGREEIINACKSFLLDQKKRGIDMDEVIQSLEPDKLKPYLYTANNPDPDLIIRTSGEVRLSGFLLWQSVYSEYYFCNTHWPQFRKIDFLRALRSYHLRKRRFGR